MFLYSSSFYWLINLFLFLFFFLLLSTPSFSSLPSSFLSSQARKDMSIFCQLHLTEAKPLASFFSFSAVSGFPIFIRVVVCGFLSGQSTSTLSTTFFQFIFFIWLYMPPFFLSRLVLHCSNISNRFSSSRFLPCTKSLEKFLKILSQLCII